MTSTTIVNPADESVLAEVAHTPLDEVDAAVARAVVAQRGWAALAPVDQPTAWHLLGSNDAFAPGS